MGGGARGTRCGVARDVLRDGKEGVLLGQC